MKIKRYFAKDVRTAIQMVRDDQGPDAVIMSNTKVDDGIEIIAAIDYDENIFNKTNKTSNYSNKYIQNEPIEAVTQGAKESHYDMNYKYSNNYQTEDSAGLEEVKKQIDVIKEMLQGQMATLAWSGLVRDNPLHVQVIKRLVSMGFSEKLSIDLTSNIADQSDPSYIWRHVLKDLVKSIKISDVNILNSGGIIALIGSTGVGKTTSIAKLAALYALKHGNRKVGLITIDNYRIAAYEQLRTYAKLIDIPVRIASTNADLNNILNDYYDKDLILIDTAGMGQYDKDNYDQAAVLDQDRFKVKKTLVISATTQSRAINDIINSFKCYVPEDCIITKMDESPTHGHIIDALIMNNMPISFITDGQKVPEDIYPAMAHNLISRCVATGNKGVEIPSDLMMTMKYEGENSNAYA